jgi:hypothetical protein
VLARRARDRRRLVGPGVVLPQPGVGGQVALPLRIEREPVVSTPIPITAWREKPGSASAAASAAFTARSSPSP